ncbi:MAG: hypothetical protein P1U74_02980 [Legionellaceae bacterium]|nr:hypothetical protein [Legionellaceae bacterium]
MSNEAKQPSKSEDLSSWFSTYNQITVERIFEQYGFKIKEDKIISILRDPESIYYQFLRIPFKNIINGIVLHQAEDYREFAQKIFVDYLLSGAGNETDAPPQGADLRESLEEERQNMMTIGDEFDVEVFNHNSLIANSQNKLIKLAKSRFSHEEEITEEDKQNLIEIIESYEEKTMEMNETLREYRREFHDLIIRVQDLAETLPNFSLDPDKMIQHREAIAFDSDIGE